MAHMHIMSRSSTHREVPFVVVREVLEEVLGGDELEDGVSEELQALVVSHGQVVVAHVAHGESFGQQPDVVELHPNGFLKFEKFLFQRIRDKVRQVLHNHWF